MVPSKMADLGTTGPQDSWHPLCHPLCPDVFTWPELEWQVTAVTWCWQASQPGESRQAVGTKEEECGPGGGMASPDSASDA